MNFNKKLAVAVSGAVLLMAGQFALADSATDIVDALVSKGILTEEEGKLITKGHTSKTSVTPVVKEKDGAFTLESASGRNSIQLTGRMHLDYRDSSIDGSGDLGGGRTDDRDTASLADQFELRRARLGVKGKFANDFKYEIVGNLPGTATIDIAYLDFAKYEQVQLRVGKFKQPFGLEQLISSNNITMMERSYLDQTVPGKKLGFQMMGAPTKGVTYAGSVFQNNDAELNIGPDGKSSLAGRATLNFAEIMGNKEMVMHLGVAGLENNYSIGTSSSSQTSTSYTSTSSVTQRGSISSFRSAGRGLSNIFRGQVNGESCNATLGNTYVSCASEYGASVKQRAFGLEGIFATGPFKLMGEYSKGDYRGSQGANTVSYDTKTYYLEAGYFITGEKYADSYKGGVFSGFKPKNEFDLDKGNLGAIELAFRAEGFDVDDARVSGGRLQGNLSSYASGKVNEISTSGATSGAKTYTAGIRWILNPNLVLKGNYAVTNLDHAYGPLDVVSATAVVDKEKLLMFRTQYMF
ncbi:OprO/OprP family phosphate-selective porin [Candidatus Methylopumilus planktonicus]|uniref:OprO/OprP family phosphate-selective porin n=1 Tax=Candidatus Methylopumilus planktonicus TaxID=1581557 RepID=UPI003BEEDE3B